MDLEKLYSQYMKELLWIDDEIVRLKSRHEKVLELKRDVYLRIEAGRNNTSTKTNRGA